MTGFFERIVRIIKSKLWKKLKNLTLTYKELHTLLFEIERIVKNRPVTYRVVDNRPVAYGHSENLESFVTPNHLIMSLKILYCII